MSKSVLARIAATGLLCLAMSDVAGAQKVQGAPDPPQTALKINGVGGEPYGLLVISNVGQPTIEIDGKTYTISSSKRLILSSAALRQCLVVSVPVAPNEYDQFLAGNIKWEGQYFAFFKNGGPSPETITVPTLTPDEEKLAADEREIKARAWAERPTIDVELDAWSAPSPGTISSDYGQKRITNGQPKIHYGVDIRLNAGDKVTAPSRGVVTLARSLVREGGTVFLYHGNGLTTAYLHLKEIDVKDGDAIEAGTLIGLGGATGLVTGPHLHWTAQLDGRFVDPTEMQTLTLPGNAVFVRRWKTTDGPDIERGEWLTIPGKQNRATCEFEPPAQPLAQVPD